MRHVRRVKSRNLDASSTRRTRVESIGRVGARWMYGGRGTGNACREGHEALASWQYFQSGRLACCDCCSDRLCANTRGVCVGSRTAEKESVDHGQGDGLPRPRSRRTLILAPTISAMHQPRVQVA